jgi:hypothetical protein
MDMVPPITTAFFPYRRPAPVATAFEQSLDDEAIVENEGGAVSLRPTMPLAGPNIAMLLEILSEAGAPVNSNHAVPRGNSKGFGRRDADGYWDGAQSNQSSFDFAE